MAAALIIWLIAFPKLSAQIPIHWDIRGEPNEYTSKLNAMLISLSTMVIPYLMLAYVPKIDPKKENYGYFSKSFTIINISLSLVFFALNLIIIANGLGYTVFSGNFVLILIGILFIILGNYMPQIKTNYFMGIKTPWALNDENNWRKTHRFGGKTFILSGFLFIFASFMPASVSEILLPIILVILFLPIGYSYWIFRKQF
nr:SdpI family protein [Neobacillus terrae]